MPTVSPETPQALCSISSDPAQPAQRHASNLRVLVVDDDQMIRLVLEGYLAKWGHVVKTATSATRALEVLSAEPPFDLILSDWVMPETNGLEFAQIVRRLYPAVQFILITGFSARLAQEDAPGVDLVVTKPASFEDIGESLTQVMSRPPRALFEQGR